MAQAQTTVSVTVSLAAFGFLKGVDPGTAIQALRRHRERLLGDLRRAVAARLEQPFEVVAGLGSLLWYHAGELLDEVFETVSGRTAPATDDMAIFAWAQAQKQHAKSKLDRGLRAEAEPVLREAISTYEQMRRLRDWERGQFAECLIIAGDPARALEVLDGVVRDRSAHWHHRRAQAQLALGRLAAALEEISAAIAQNGEEKYQATFLHERWRIRLALGEKEAIEDLREAHRVCQSGKYKEQLGRELAEAEQGPS
jgi:hypothetical protein